MLITAGLKGFHHRPSFHKMLKSSLEFFVHFKMFEMKFIVIIPRWRKHNEKEAGRSFADIKVRIYIWIYYAELNKISITQIVSVYYIVIIVLITLVLKIHKPNLPARIHSEPQYLLRQFGSKLNAWHELIRGFWVQSFRIIKTNFAL